MDREIRGQIRRGLRLRCLDRSRELDGEGRKFPPDSEFPSFQSRKLQPRLR